MKRSPIVAVLISTDAQPAKSFPQASRCLRRITTNSHVTDDRFMIEPGQQAPDLGLPDQDGRPVELSDFRGQAVVVYFYPKADTPGCTAQACGVRDHNAEYAAAGAVVLGISPDPVAKLKRFQEKHALGFPLLSDGQHAVADAYGVWVQKSMYGRTYFGNERTTFIIDPKS
jgi:thioredoxin-dependent peroxiredoxin